MRFTIIIDTANAAFHEEDCPDTEAHECSASLDEIARILTGAAGDVLNPSMQMGTVGVFDLVSLRDTNGNPVGYMQIS